jgi:hypothetical protein
MNGLYSFKMSGTDYLVMQHHMPEDWSLQPHCCGSLKTCSRLHLMERLSSTELRVLHNRGEWGKLTHQLCGLISIHQIQPEKAEAVVLKLVTTKFEIPNIEIHEL